MGAAASGLLEVISKDPPVHEKEIGELWDALDSNKNGVLDNTEASQFFFNLFEYLGSLHEGVVDNKQKYVQHWLRILDVDRNKQITRSEFDHVLKQALQRPTLFELRHGPEFAINGCPMKKEYPIVGGAPCPPPVTDCAEFLFVESLAGNWTGKNSSVDVAVEITRPGTDNVRNKGFLVNQCLQLIEYKITVKDTHDVLVSREVGVLLFEFETNAFANLPVDHNVVTRHGIGHRGETYTMHGHFHTPKKFSELKLKKISPITMQILKDNAILDDDKVAVLDLCEGGSSVDIGLVKHDWPAKTHCSTLLVTEVNSVSQLVWSQIVMKKPLCVTLTK